LIDASADPVKRYLESSEIKIALKLSVCPTSLPVLLPVRGSHNRITRSGDPDAMVLPKGSAARAYTDDLGAVASGGFKVTSASVVV
jgi:hypothetical protein